MDDFSVSLLQIGVSGETPKNIARMREMARSVSRRTDALALPEMWAGENASCDEAELAIGALSDSCRESGVFAVSGGIPWKSGGQTTVRMWAIDDLGHLFAHYDKVHLSSKGGEAKKFAPGNAPLVFMAGEVACAALSGYDLMFPEFCRQLSLAGARFFFVSASWPEELAGSWELAIRSCAFLNQSYVVACNGSGPRAQFRGHSAIVSPEGEIVERLGGEEGILTASFSLAEADRRRADIPIETDR
ncbi:MAG: hypothetical protein LBQ36_06780, partial [Synergistaceae bacterium]|nr:hypothetical protein [Synergistaceae bacterium]